LRLVKAWNLDILMKKCRYMSSAEDIISTRRRETTRTN